MANKSALDDAKALGFCMLLNLRGQTTNLAVRSTFRKSQIVSLYSILRFSVKLYFAARAGQRAEIFFNYASRIKESGAIDLTARSIEQ